MKKIKRKLRAGEIRHKGAKFNIKRRCKICGYTWFPKLRRPLRCPSCRTLL